MITAELHDKFLKELADIKQQYQVLRLNFAEGLEKKNIKILDYPIYQCLDDKILDVRNDLLRQYISIYQSIEVPLADIDYGQCYADYIQAGLPGCAWLKTYLDRIYKQNYENIVREKITKAITRVVPFNNVAVLASDGYKHYMSASEQEISNYFKLKLLRGKTVKMEMYGGHNPWDNYTYVELFLRNLFVGTAVTEPLQEGLIESRHQRLKGAEVFKKQMYKKNEMKITSTKQFVNKNFNIVFETTKDARLVVDTLLAIVLTVLQKNKNERKN